MLVKTPEIKFFKSNWHHFRARAPMCAKIYLQIMHSLFKRGRSVPKFLADVGFISDKTPVTNVMQREDIKK